MTSSLADRLGSSDLGGFPDPAGLNGDELAQILWIVWMISEVEGTTTVSPGEVSAVARDLLRVNIPRQRVEGTLRRAPTYAARRKVDGRWRYQVMQEGIDYVTRAERGILFIEPENALSQVRAVQEVLSGLRGVVRICDPYLSLRTLDFLVHCSAAAELRVLTGQVNSKAAFLGDLKAARSQLGQPINVRVAPAKLLHDRYVIDDDALLLFGTSFNGLGGKQSFVVHAGEDMRDLALEAFDRLWGQSSGL